MMSNVSHTPGPWRVSHHFSTVDGRQIECDPDPGMFDACIMTTNSDGRLIAIAGERGSKLNPYDYLPVAESVANMRLIAAAPDLLAACEEVAAWIDEPGKGRALLYPHLANVILPKLNAAIAAAKGEQ